MAVDSVSARGRYSGGSHTSSRPSRVTRTVRSSSTYHPPVHSSRPTVTHTTVHTQVSKPAASTARTTVISSRPTTHVTHVVHTPSAYSYSPTVQFAPTWGYSSDNGFGWSFYRDYSQPIVVHQHQHHAGIFTLIFVSIIMLTVFGIFCVAICYSLFNDQNEEDVIIAEVEYNREDTAECRPLKMGDEEDVVEEQQITYEYHPDGGVTEHRTQVVTKYEYTEHNSHIENQEQAIAMGKPMMQPAGMPQMSTAGTSAMSYPNMQSNNNGYYPQQQQMQFQQQQYMNNGPPQSVPMGMPMNQHATASANFTGSGAYYNNGMH